MSDARRKRFSFTLLLLLACQQLAAAEPVPLVVDAPLAPPARLALDDLEQALQAKGFETPRQESLEIKSKWSIVAGVANASPAVDRLLAEHRIALPEPAESLCIKQLAVGDRHILLLAGRDARGLSYAVLEAARAIDLAPQGQDPFQAVEAA